jgi:tetraacyldisaccharide 4'-kinase
LIKKTQKLLAPVLCPAGKIYGSVMGMRSKMYARGTFSRFDPECPCVSVGNIGSGGSGKTPLSGWLLDWALSQGLAPALLSRGYRAAPPKLPYLVKPESPVQEAGDEPLMLAIEHPGAKIVVDPVRIRSASWVTRHYGPGIFILDDGFQHLAVRRDFDMVLLTPEDIESGWNRVIPRGTWREGAKALNRADVFLIKCRPFLFDEMRDDIKKRLQKFKKPVFQFSLKPRALRRLGGRETRPGLNESYILVSGVGNPEQLEVTANLFMGRSAEEHVIFKDHHSYTRDDIAAIRRTASHCGVREIICTPKDAVKLKGLGADDFWTFDLDIEFSRSIFFDGSEPETFDSWWSLNRINRENRK